jgi:hypothetical protein
MVRDFLLMNHIILQLLPLPQGRLYVGGDFDTYRGTAVKTIMRINLLDGSNNLLPVGAGPNGTVWSLKRQGDGKINTRWRILLSLAQVML